MQNFTDDLTQFHMLFFLRLDKVCDMRLIIPYVAWVDILHQADLGRKIFFFFFFYYHFQLHAF